MSINSLPRLTAQARGTVTVRPPAVVPTPAAARALRVLAADPDPTAAGVYRAALGRLGHEVQMVTTGPDLVEACRLLGPDVVVAAVGLPGLDGLAAAAEVCRSRPVPVVLVADSFEPQWVARVLATDWVMACLARPLDAGALGAAVAVAARRFEQARSLGAEAAELRQALEDRKVIERAKGAVTRRTGLAEDEAYQRMRSLASHANRKLADVAQQILEAEATFRDLDGVATPRGTGAGHWRAGKT
jgi:response regulator NasT